MAFRDPFKNYPDINANNVTNIPLYYLKRAPVDSLNFKDSVEKLIDIQEKLKALEYAGINIEGFQYVDIFVQVVNWLACRSATIHFVAIEKLNSLEDIDDDTAAKLYDLIRQLRNALIANNAEYSNINMVMGAVKASRRFESLEPEAQKILDKFEGAAQDTATKLNFALDNSSQNLRRAFESTIRDLGHEKDSAIEEIQKARALARWAAYYGALVKEYREQIWGKQLKYSRKDPVKKREIKKHQSLTTRGIAAIKNSRLSICFQNMLLWLKSYSGQRTVWFTLLSVILLSQSLIFILALLGYELFGINISRIVPQHNDTLFLFKLFIFGSILIVPVLGYATSNKNLRIYSNLYEQYRHREIVAKTLQGILIEADESGDNKDVREKLTEVAAQAMFEHKTIGHLTKHEGHFSPVAEIVQTFSSK